jgi:class III poly(R)-hydroxyalkanoic acid synthase PhaE subunit
VYLRFAAPATTDIGRMLMEQWMAYLRWGESLVPGAKGEAAPTPFAADWAAAIGRLFGQGGRGAAPTGTWGETDVMRGLFAFWGLPLDMWGRVMASLSAFPGDALAGPKEAAGQQDSGEIERGPLQRFLAIPPMGYAREHQERGQKAMQDWLGYQRALGVFTSILTRIAMRTGEAVQHRFAERGKPFESLRQAYELFVDCAEDAYAEVVTAADFGKVIAELMNTAMAVKRHAQAMAEEMANAANLPTRRELDTSHRQLQQLRRQMRALQDQLRRQDLVARAAGESSTEVFEREVGALRDEMAELRSRVDAAPARAAGVGRGRQLRAQHVED